MPDYILFLHENFGRHDGRSHDEMMATVGEYGAWARKTRAEGKLKGGEKLTGDAGRVLRPKPGGAETSNGPYSPNGEIIGGLFTITAADYGEACRIAATCPHLKFGGRIENREIHAL